MTDSKTRQLPERAPVVIIGGAEDNFGVLSNVKAWVGTVDE